MIGSTVSRRSPFLNGKRRAGGGQRKSQPEQRRSAGGHQRQSQGAPGGTATAAFQATQAPDGRILHIGDQAIGFKRTVHVLYRGDKHAQYRIEYEGGHQRDQQHNGRYHKGIPLQHAAFGQREREQQQKGGDQQNGTGAKGRLAVAERAKQLFAPLPVPAAVADGVAFKQQKQDADDAGTHQQLRAQTAHRQQACRRANQQHQQGNKQPGTLKGGDLPQRRCAGLILPQRTQPAKVEEPGFLAVPGQ